MLLLSQTKVDVRRTDDEKSLWYCHIQNTIVARGRRNMWRPNGSHVQGSATSAVHFCWMLREILTPHLILRTKHQTHPQSNPPRISRGPYILPQLDEIVDKHVGFAQRALARAVQYRHGCFAGSLFPCESGPTHYAPQLVGASESTYIWWKYAPAYFMRFQIFSCLCMPNHMHIYMRAHSLHSSYLNSHHLGTTQQIIIWPHHIYYLHWHAIS